MLGKSVEFIDLSETRANGSQVFSSILSRHPEVIQISMAAYRPLPHGAATVDFQRDYFPVVTEKVVLAEGKWRTSNDKSKEIVALGSVVDVCNEPECNHSPKSHYEINQIASERPHTYPFGQPQSFVFVDMEAYSPETYQVTKRVLTENVPQDWYILNSGAGFHVIIDHLVPLDSLAGEYGNLINCFGRHLSKPTLSAWGHDLIHSSGNVDKIKSWCHDVLKSCGHAHEPTNLQVHLIDMRYLAHSLLRALETQRLIKEFNLAPVNREVFSSEIIGAAYLRVSAKRPGDSTSPELIAQKTALGFQENIANLDFLPRGQKRLL